MTIITLNSPLPLFPQVTGYWVSLSMICINFREDTHTLPYGPSALR